MRTTILTSEMGSGACANAFKNSQAGPAVRHGYPKPWGIWPCFFPLLPLPTPPSEPPIFHSSIPACLALLSQGLHWYSVPVQGCPSFSELTCPALLQCYILHKPTSHVSCHQVRLPTWASCFLDMLPGFSSFKRACIYLMHHYSSLGFSPWAHSSCLRRLSPPAMRPLWLFPTYSEI